MQKVITGTIHQGDFDALKQIMRDQSSCRRYAYNRIHKDGLSKANDVVKACKPLYMGKLNQRYIQDGVLRAKSVKQEHCLFGGKKNWKKLLCGLITKDQWHEIRDSELYSRGDRTKKGNPNIRVLRTPEGYTSIVGILKYQDMYSLNRHTAAALVGRGFEIALTEKACSYFKHLYRVVEVKPPGLTAPCLNST